jgi:hypothetical protein
MENQQAELGEMFKQIETLENPMDRALNFALLFVGEAILILLNSRNQKQLIEFRKRIIQLFDEASKAIVNSSANAN